MVYDATLLPRALYTMEEGKLYCVEGLINVKDTYKARLLNPSIPNTSIEVKLEYPESKITQTMNSTLIFTLFKPITVEIEHNSLSRDEFVKINPDTFTEDPVTTYRQFLVYLLNQFNVKIKGCVEIGMYGTLRMHVPTIYDISK